MAEHQTFSLRINAQSPLVLGDENNLGNNEQTISYIPGAVIRGAIGSKALGDCINREYIADHAHCPDRDNCPFWQLFGQDDIHFGNAYPGMAGPVYPFPLTARTCKYYPGLPQEDIFLDEFHGVFDSLVDRFVYEVLSDPDFPMRSQLLPGFDKVPKLQGAYQDKCPECGETTERAEGYFIPGPTISPGAEPFIRRAAHVGINRSRSVAEDGLLFSQETLDTHGTLIQFYGQVTVTSERVDLLKKYLHGTHYFGRGRSRGFGQVEIGVNPPQARPAPMERIRDFQLALNAELSSYREYDPDIPSKFSGTLLCLTTQSPALLEEFGRPYLVPTAEDILFQEVVLVRAWTRPMIISGWDAAAGLPRRTRLAACPGSVYVYYVPSGNVSDSVLDTLEREGIGTERARGLGQIEICSPFHSHNTRREVDHESN